MKIDTIRAPPVSKTEKMVAIVINKTFLIQIVIVIYEGIF